MTRNKGWTCTGREVQFLALATGGQEVTASGLEDGPVGDWLVVGWWGGDQVGRWGGGGCSASGNALITDT